MKIALNEPLVHFFDNAARPRISLYFPTHRAGPETRQGPIRLKNLLREARDQLIQQGHEEEAVQKMLRPAADLGNDLDFWRHQQEGLAILLSPDEMRLYKLPYPVDEIALAAEHFHLRPLFPLFSQEDSFHLLAFSKNQVQLYEGNRYSLRSVDVPGIPRSLDEELQFDEAQPHLQQYSSGPGGIGGTPVFHGYGGEKDVHLNQLLRYCRSINKGIRDHLRDSRLPMVLAGVEYLLSIYREANSYPHLLEEGVTGGLDGMTEKELHDRAWNIVRPHLRIAQEKAMQRFDLLANAHNGNGSGKTATSIEQAVIAAYEGRVDALLIPNNKQIWGEFHETTQKVKTETKDPSKRRELLDVAALNTLLHGGEVFVLKPEEMPNGSPIAALLRYEAA